MSRKRVHPLKKRYGEFLLYLKYWAYRKQVPTKKFVILMNARSGSTLLVDLLNCHPHIHCDTEIFSDFERLRPSMVLFPHWYMKGRSARKNKIQVYGFKMKVTQLEKILSTRWHGEPDTYLNYLHHSGWIIIHLKRTNIFRKAVSSIVAKSTNRWHVKEDDHPGQKVSIAPDQLLADMKSYEEIMRGEELMLKGIPHLSIVYEDELLDACNHQKTMDRVYAYIGVPSVRAKTQWRRTGPDDLSETIENYQEIYHAVRKSPFARFLPREVGEGYN